MSPPTGRADLCDLLVVTLFLCVAAGLMSSMSLRTDDDDVSARARRSVAARVASIAWQVGCQLRHVTKHLQLDRLPPLVVEN